jgi:hypothetical protein
MRPDPATSKAKSMGGPFSILAFFNKPILLLVSPAALKATPSGKGGLWAKSIPRQTKETKPAKTIIALKHLGFNLAAKTGAPSKRSIMSGLFKNLTLRDSIASADGWVMMKIIFFFKRLKTSQLLP